MALPQPRSEQELVPAARTSRRSTARVADPSMDLAVPSPVHSLQQSLADDLQVREDKWPPAATLAFILVTCGTFWTAVAWLVARALQHG